MYLWYFTGLQCIACAVYIYIHICAFIHTYTDTCACVVEVAKGYEIEPLLDLSEVWTSAVYHAGVCWLICFFFFPE